MRFRTFPSVFRKPPARRLPPSPPPDQVSVSALAIALAGLLCAGPAPAGAATTETPALLSAEQLIQRVQAGEHSAKTPTTTTNGFRALRAALEEFRTAGPQLPPAVAAQRWLAFSDGLPGVVRSTSDRRRFAEDFPSGAVSDADLLDFLPPPAAWPELAKAIAARLPTKDSSPLRELGLRLLAAELTGDRAARRRALAEIPGLAEKLPAASASQLRQASQQLESVLLDETVDPEALLKSLEAQLSQLPAGGESRSVSLRVPALVSLVGAPRAESFLRRALREPGVRLEFADDAATGRLARTLAVEMVNELKAPPWRLAFSLEAVELYEALDRRFRQPKAAAPDPSEVSALPNFRVPDDLGGDSDQRQARTYYWLGLIRSGRLAEATVLARKLANSEASYSFREGLQAMERAGYAPVLDDFFHALLSQDPNLPFWDEYVGLAARAGRTGRLLQLVKSAAARDDLRPLRRSEIRQNLYRALLAADAVEEGAAELRRLLAAEPDAAPRRALSQSTESRRDLALRLARLGERTGHREWIDEGLAALRRDFGPESPEVDSNGELPRAVLVDLFLAQGRPAEAQKLLLAELLRHVQVADPANRWETEVHERLAAEVLHALALLYHRTGRSADLVALLETAPWWGHEDLAETLAEEPPTAFRRRGGTAALPSLAFLAAHALLEVGRREDARRITDALLRIHPGSDRGYELLLRLAGPEALPILDRLAAQDRFEERPLIWKAELLRSLNRLEEAETTARQAIAIDPSDGEQGPGDRLRGYAVLAEIREARGDRREAETLRQAVAAIRQSEEADAHEAAGLLRRAIRMHEGSLQLFADAYCVHARLALQLSEAGQQDAAEEHYRRAYELMPESFGRVESHCFGCERAFDDERAQSVAEKVFTRILAAQPRNPQIHYLLGYLREEQQRFPEAARAYQQAVALDPDYLNAWSRLQGLDTRALLPAAMRDQIVAQLLRLDPESRHTYVFPRRATDLAALWNAVDRARERREPPLKAVFALPASRVALSQDPERRADRQRRREFAEEQLRQQTSPGYAVAQTPYVTFAAELLTLGTRGTEGE